jgi:hypothetical protein
MEDEYNNNPWDELEERFSKLETKGVDIPHNMAILMAALEKRSLDLSGILVALT